VGGKDPPLNLFKPVMRPPSSNKDGIAKADFSILLLSTVILFCFALVFAATLPDPRDEWAGEQSKLLAADGGKSKAPSAAF